MVSFIHFIDDILTVPSFIYLFFPFLIPLLLCYLFIVPSFVPIILLHIYCIVILIIVFLIRHSGRRWERHCVVEWCLVMTDDRKFDGGGLLSLSLFIPFPNHCYADPSSIVVAVPLLVMTDIMEQVILKFIPTHIRYYSTPFIPITHIPYPSHHLGSVHLLLPFPYTLHICPPPLTLVVVGGLFHIVIYLFVIVKILLLLLLFIYQSFITFPFP